MLSDDLNVLSENDVISKDIPAYISDNLNPTYPLRKYQIETISRLIYYLGNYKRRVKPSHLLFHLATGSGKTLVMAASILHLYQLGYRNFIFFVNSTNILEKTKDNFLNSLSPKYQFAQRIYFNDKEVKIVSVENFDGIGKEDITILFTTIQGLHTRLNSPGENQITFEDFLNKKIVLLSDEAHHINATTKSKLPVEEAADLRTWESTVTNILKSSPENVLLEFTATIGMSDPNIRAKYSDKILMEYTLKQFRQDGFSKEVKVIQTDLDPEKRALQTIVVSQYRRKVAGNHHIALKPVVLFKSRTIDESVKFESEFHRLVANVKAADLRQLNTPTAPEIVQSAFRYFEASGISLDNLINEIQQEFSEDRCISVNSKNDSIEKQITVNNLETNEYRVVFTVNMLNEGWDVLNLFDIVRLYNTRDAKGGKPGPTTIAEAQLIGRGARYFPFGNGDISVRFTRKYDTYDGDVSNELKILEELYYHSENNPRYIQELHTALVETGIVPNESKEVMVHIKEDFKQKEFWGNGIIFLNKRVKNDFGGIFGFANANIPDRYKVSLRTGFSQTIVALDEEIGQVAVNSVISTTYLLTDFPKQILKKAIQKNRFYEFSNLKIYFPHLKSITEFLDSNNYLGEVKVEVQGRRDLVENLPPDEKLFITTEVLHGIENHIKSESTDYVGTKTFYPTGIRFCIKDKTLKMAVSDASDQEFGVAMSQAKHYELQLNLVNEDWYIYDENYGTYEEKALIKFIYSRISQLKKKYQDVYLLRNEKLFQIYRFSDGAAIEPDFVLFMKKNDEDKIIGYQLFIEPKGEHLIAEDQWKEDFLLEIEKECRVDLVLQNQEYKIIGLPFFNDNNAEKKTAFEEAFAQI